MITLNDALVRTLRGTSIRGLRAIAFEYGVRGFGRMTSADREACVQAIMDARRKMNDIGQLTPTVYFQRTTESA